MSLAEVGDRADAIVRNIERVLTGMHDSVLAAFTVTLAGGHLLIEDVPGVGKTMLAKALARSVDGSVSRIQFTADLLPGDVTGVSVFDQVTKEFVFKPGPVFHNVVIGDEINRASPKTQAALLECMEEGQVTVDGNTHALPRPFTVVATQNPVEMEGTYPLPEAQRDRFMARISMGYPSLSAEVDMLTSHEHGNPIDGLDSVVSIDELEQMQQAVLSVYTSRAVKEYAVAIAVATREDRQVRLGASPRATLQLLAAARARAALVGRDFVLPDDIDALAVPVLAHRLVLTGQAVSSGDESAEASIIRSIVDSTPAPSGAARR
ncbi:MAG TPA: AAA family ATPase [Candidatus Lumbricidophila sp.]|nr:AAA family ATPase [Candidatus Lumbricidophila sp.]